jgi:phosphonate transport system substrate-binding protein
MRYLPNFGRAFFATLILSLVAIFHPAAQQQAKADWRSDVGIFRVGFVVEGDRAAHLARLEPFRLVLTDELGIEVEFYPAPDAMALINAFTSARIEYAVLPAIGYALAEVACKCIEPLVVPKAGDSTDGFHAVLIGRPGGPVSASELSGRTVASLDRESMTGHKLVMNLLVSEGLLASPESIGLHETASPSGAVESLIEGKADALIGWSSLTGNPAEGYSRGTLRQINRLTQGRAPDYPVLWKSPQIPHHPHVVRRKLGGEAKRLLRDTLLNLYEDDALAYDAVEPVLGGGFAATRPDRFNMLVRFVDGMYKAPEPVTEPDGEKDPSDNTAVEGSLAEQPAVDG